MDLCRAKTKNGSRCRNQAGRGTYHSGFGYCHMHDDSEEANKIRKNILRIIDENRYHNLEKYVSDEEVNVDLSIGKEKTWLNHAVKNGDRQAAEIILKHGGSKSSTGWSHLSDEEFLAEIHVDKEMSVLKEKNISAEAHPWYEMDGRELLHSFLSHWKLTFPAALLVLILAFIPGLAETIGTTLSIVGLIWLIMKIKQRIQFRKRRKKEEELFAESYSKIREQHSRVSLSVPVWIFTAGGFFVLIADRAVTGFPATTLYVAETAVFVLFLGFFILFLSELFMRGYWRKYRLPLIIFFFLNLIFTGITDTEDQSSRKLHDDLIPSPVENSFQ
jgi:hypothetical protein